MCEVKDGDRRCVGVELEVMVVVVEDVLWLDWFGIVRLLASCEWSRRIFASDIGSWRDRFGGGMDVVVVGGVVVVMDLVSGALAELCVDGNRSDMDDRRIEEFTKVPPADTISNSVRVLKTRGNIPIESRRIGLTLLSREASS